MEIARCARRPISKPRPTCSSCPRRPTSRVHVREAFGIDVRSVESGRSAGAPSTSPTSTPTYQFDRDTTLAILAGFAHNRRVMIQGYHGTGKSTHIEQVAARLNWPCIRVNLDSHISRIDLIGKDAIVLRDGKQITEYREGILPWSLQRPVALVLRRVRRRPARRHVRDPARARGAGADDPARPEQGDPRRTPRSACSPPPTRWASATPRGLYHGTQQINQGQMDRWSVVTQLNYLDHDDECRIILAKCPTLRHAPRAARRSPPWSSWPT